MSLVNCKQSLQGVTVTFPGFVVIGHDPFKENSGNFGPKLNGSVWSNWKSFEKTGPPFEVDHFSGWTGWNFG